MDKSIALTVKEVLENNQDARNSYNFLIMCVLARYGIHLTPDQRKIFLGMPSVTSIDRAARKLWQEHLAPMPSQKTQQRRKKLQEEFRAEMRGHWDFAEGKAKWIASPRS